ncbi:MAG: hypothetical protein ABIP39_11915 [Polyangiaceae bacterium]
MKLALVGIGVVAIAACAKPLPPAAPVEEVAIGAPSSASASPANSATGASTKVDAITTFAGATLGDATVKGLTPDPHPPVELLRLKGSTWYVEPAAHPTINGVPVPERHLHFFEGRLIGIEYKIEDAAACKRVLSEFREDYGAPAAFVGTAFQTYDWMGKRESLHFAIIGASGCGGTLSDSTVPLEAYAPTPDPGASSGGTHGLDHFGPAKLGADRSSYPGLKERDKKGSDVWVNAADPSFKGVSFQRLTYMFRDGKLLSVGFDAQKFADCPRLLAALTTEYGRPGDESGNFGGGKSYEWTTGATTLKFNVFSSQCGGILFSGKAF